MILADPGLLLAPDAGLDALNHWTEVIAWGSDRRLRLGRESYEWLFRVAEAEGWSLYEAATCPPPLRRQAIRSVGRLLAAPTVPSELADDIYEVEPPYVRHPEGGAVVAIDLTSEWDDEVFALASRPQHWATPCAAVCIRNCATPLAFSPTFRSESERIGAARALMAGMRVTVVGGLRGASVAADLEELLDITSDRLRWIEAEPGKQPNLNGLLMLRADRDVVCCVLGAPGQLGLGHAGSEKARRLADRAGARVVVVKRPSEISRALIQAFGTT